MTMPRESIGGGEQPVIADTDGPPRNACTTAHAWGDCMGACVAVMEAQVQPIAREEDLRYLEVFCI